MAGLVPAIHVPVSRGPLTWMPATSAGMTMEFCIRHHTVVAPAQAGAH